MASAIEKSNLTAMLAGVWKRRWEEDPLGCDEDKVDRSTMVVWTQTPCGIYVDLRLPAGAPGRQDNRDRAKRPEALLANGVCGGEYTDNEIALLLQQKSFAGRLQCSLGDTTDGRALKDDLHLADLVKANAGPIPLCTCFWVRIIDFQPPSGLDIGVCASSSMNTDGTVDMRETGDDASYAEGWHRMAGTSEGPFVALELVSEDGKARKGFWVRTGNRFAYAVGRPEDEEAAVSLACPLLSPKVKDCKGMSLSEAIKFMTNDRGEEMAVVSCYVGLVGEVKDNGLWLIDASNLAELVGCILVASDGKDSLCCSTLCVALDDCGNDVGVGTLLDQTIHSHERGDVVRRWKVVELSSSASLPLSN